MSVDKTVLGMKSMKLNICFQAILIDNRQNHNKRFGFLNLKPELRGNTRLKTILLKRHLQIPILKESENDLRTRGVNSDFGHAFIVILSQDLAL